MKISFIKLILIFSVIFIVILVGCNKKEDLGIKKIEISKVSFEGGESFEPEKMKIERTWTLSGSK